MKLFDKIKDLFMDEVIEDDEIELEEEEKKEYQEPPKNVLPKVMRETIKEEEKEIEKEEPLDDADEFIRSFKRREMVQEEKPEIKEEKKPEPVIPQPKKFSFPIEFDEDEIPTRKSNTGNINVLSLEKESNKKVNNLYPEKEEVEFKSKFRATPVISPVYGILDKNYTKEEVKERDEEMVEMKRPSKKVDFETVRKKAFGNLADEIKDNLMCENCELYKEVKKISALKEDDLLYDMTVEDEKPEEEKDVTIETAYDNYHDFGVAYEPKKVKKSKIEEEPDEEANEKLEEDKTKFDDIINTVQEDDTSEPIEEEETPTQEKPEVIYSDKVEDDTLESDEEEPIPSRSEKKSDTKVDADFFELIDSMYKERADE